MRYSVNVYVINHIIIVIFAQELLAAIPGL